MVILDDDAAELPELSTKDPDAPALALPLAIVMAPDAPAAVVPELNTNDPDTPADIALPVTNRTLPEADDTLDPETMDTEPLNTLAPAVCPARMMTLPPL